jgi:uncharacterized protein (TIGR03066 family)
MKTRLRLLLMLITCGGLFALSWFLFVHKPAPEQPDEPPPKEKTTAELLVGTWELVRVDSEIVSPQSTIVAKFSRDGRFTFQATGEGVPHQPRTGTYELDGHTIRFNADADADGSGKRWDVVIELLTETELVTVAGSPENRQRSICKRVEEN